jgi:hypothetical protein
LKKYGLGDKSADAFPKDFAKEKCSKVKFISLHVCTKAGQRFIMSLDFVLQFCTATDGSPEF